MSNADVLYQQCKLQEESTLRKSIINGLECSQDEEILHFGNYTSDVLTDTLTEQSFQVTQFHWGFARVFLCSLCVAFIYISRLITPFKFD